MVNVAPLIRVIAEEPFVRIIARAHDQSSCASIPKRGPPHSVLIPVAGPPGPKGEDGSDATQWQSLQW